MDRAELRHGPDDVPSVGRSGVFAVGPGLLLNLSVTAAVQVVTVLLALLLDQFGFSTETTIILFVLGVLVTAIFTDGPIYSIAASALSVITFNFFIVDPRMSLRAWGPNYPASFVVMFLVALTASYLVAAMRASVRASMEATVKARNEQTRAALLRSVSHDLRTPLTSIIGNSDILLSDGEGLDKEQRQRLTQDIHDDATWLADVVENLLAITRFDEEQVALNMCPEVVDEVIEEALRHVRRDARGHAVVVIPSDELLMARMDAQVIVQVIVNLVNNALAHTPDGSLVTIKTAAQADFVQVTVADDGPGVDPADRERVFDPFFTEDMARTDGRRGIGLGLSLCKTIVQAHGGTIWVDPVEPHGASFSFTLPRVEVPEDV